MPRFPHRAKRTEVLGESVFEAFAPLLRSLDEPFIKLHIGDADATPPFDLGYDREFLAQHPYALQYANTWGTRRLREAIVRKLAEDNGIETAREGVLVTAGASNALSAAAHTLFEPGDEVLVLTPAWPFFFGMVRMTGATVRELPFYPRWRDESGFDVEAVLEEAITARTVAIYVNSPNNPSGVVLDAASVAVIARCARRHDLWLLADEAYDGLVLEGDAGPNLGSLEDVRDRTLSIFTFSKSFLCAGLRLGWVTGAPDVLRDVNKVMVHQVYGPTVPAQMMLTEPLARRHDWIEGVRRLLRERRDAFLAALDLPVAVPHSTYFVFFDLQPWLRGRTASEVVEACIRSGVAVTPGGDFGRDFGNWVRVCFTADRPERTLEGARRLRAVLEG